MVCYEQPLLSMSLDGYAEQSLLKNLDYKAANEALLSKEALVRAAWGKWFPQVELRMGASQTNVSSSSQLPVLSNLPSNQTNDSSQSSNIIALIARQKILDFSSTATLNMARLEKEASAILYQMSEQKTLFLVANTYFDVLTSQSSIQAAELFKKLTHETYKQAVKHESLGLTTRTQVMRAKVQHQAAISKELRAKQSYQHLLKLLNQLSQTDSKHVEPLKKNILLELPKPPTKEHWIQLALKHNFDLKLLKLKLSILKLGIKEAAGKHWPNIFAYAAYMKGKNLGSEDPADLILSSLINRTQFKYQGSVVGLTAKLPLFAGGEISNVEQEKIHENHQELLKFQNFCEQLRLQIDEHYDNLILSHTEISQADYAVQAELEALQVQKLELNEGKITPIQYLETENQLYESMMKQAVAKHNYIKNLNELNYLTGQFDLNTINKINRWLKKS